MAMFRRTKTPPILRAFQPLPVLPRLSRAEKPKQRGIRHEIEERMRYSLVTKTFLAGVAADVLRLRLHHAARVRRKSLSDFLTAHKASILAGIGNERHQRELVLPSLGQVNIRNWNLKLLCTVLKSVKCLDLKEIEDVIHLDQTYRNHFDDRSQVQNINKKKESKEKRRWVKTSAAVQRLVDTSGDSKTIREVRDFICRVDFVPNVSRIQSEKYKREQLIYIVDDLIHKKHTESENKRKLKSIKRQLTSLSKDSTKHTREQRPVSAPPGSMYTYIPREMSPDMLSLPRRSILRSPFRIYKVDQVVDITGVVSDTPRNVSAPPSPVSTSVVTEKIQVESDTYDQIPKQMKEPESIRKASEITKVEQIDKKLDSLVGTLTENRTENAKHHRMDNTKTDAKLSRPTTGRLTPNTVSSGRRSADVFARKQPTNYGGYEARIRKLSELVLAHRLVEEVAYDHMFENKNFIDAFFKYLKHHKLTKSFLRTENASAHKTWQNLEGTESYFCFLHYLVFRTIHVRATKEESIILLIHKVLFRIDCDHEEKAIPQKTIGTPGTCWRCEQKELALSISVHWGNYAINQLLVSLGTRCKEQQLIFAVKARDLTGIKQVVTFLKQGKCWFVDNDIIKQALYIAKSKKLNDIATLLESEGVVDDQPVKHKVYCPCSFLCCTIP